MPDKKYFIFGEGGGKAIAEEFGVNLLGQVPLDINMRERTDNGLPAILDKNAQVQSDILKEIVSRIASETRKLNYLKVNQKLPQISL
jgi:ATP-binding protein involved in chromosome partitioning